MAFSPAEHREWRNELKRRGICVICHTRCPDCSTPKESCECHHTTRATCHTCATKTNDARRVRRRLYRKTGRCPECGSTEIVGHASCKKHYLADVGTARRRRAKRIAQGLCVTCGIDAEGYGEMCGGCRLDESMYRRFGTHTMGR